MDGRQSKSACRLWLEAVRSRWSLRLAAGEGAWRLAWRMLRWLRWFSRQTQWLRTVDGSAAMRQAARADPRLYERWHRPYVSPRFAPDARRRIIAAHYAFVEHRLPARMRERILRGHDVRLATLRLAGAAPASLHLRKPARAEAGELALLLLDVDREALASCVLTFGGEQGLLVAPPQGALSHAGDAAIRAFLRGSRGVHPQALLHALVRALAAHYGLACVHAGPLRNGPDDGLADGRFPAPPEQGEAFRHQACAVFLDAFRGPLPGHAQTEAQASADAPARSTADAGEGLLAAGL
jgi:uncharacterized protein VirK/YbjX